MDFIDLSELEKKTPEEQIKIKIDIILHNDLSKIPVMYLPDVFVDEYYFISYSHLDYKLVYQDIFDLQSHGLNTWYDRGIPANQNWMDTAKKYITPYACKGVIFYLSRNSLKSDPVKDEIYFVLRTHKPFIVVILPDEDGNELLPIKLGEQLLKEGLIDEDRLQFIKDAFPNENIYLMYSSPVSNKIEKINLLPSEPLLKINTNYSRITTFKGRNHYGLNSMPNVHIVISSLNDYYATSVRVHDYYDILNYPDIYERCSNYYKGFDANHRISGPMVISFSLDSAAFSNMKNLEYFELPVFNGEIVDIPKYAFYGCKELKEVKFVHDEDDNVIINIRDDAFNNCEKLETIDFSHVASIGTRAFFNCQSIKEMIGRPGLSEIGDAAFYNCSSLTGVYLSNCTPTIGKSAFAYSGLEQIALPLNLKEIKDETFKECQNLKYIVLPDFLMSIGDNAFMNCQSLTSLVIPPLVKRIGKYAFACCFELKELRLPKDIKIVEPEAFLYCSKLTVIDYDGTVEEWKQKGFKNIFGEKRRCIIYCTDDNYEYNE